MTTIWHESKSFSTYSSNYHYPPAHQCNPPEDSYNEISGPPDFSEFKDPWDNYQVHNDPYSNTNKQSSDDGKTHSCNTITHCTEQTVSDNHHHPTELTSPPSSSSNHESSNRYDHVHSHSHENSQSARQESFTPENESRHCNAAADTPSEQHNQTNENVSDAQWLSENLDQINALCECIEEFQNIIESPDENSDHQDSREHHTDNYSKPSTSTAINNYSKPSTSTTINNYSKPRTSTTINTSHTSRESSKKAIGSDKSRTKKSHNPSKSSKASRPRTNSHNVTTQFVLSASPSIENAEVSSLISLILITFMFL